MSQRTLTTESGAPVVDNQNSATAGPNGPVLIQDQHLVEKLARFNRERIPERIVHARGSGAFGHFVVTRDVTRYTRAAFLSAVGKTTETFLRVSTVAGNLGSADAVRDPRGFALRFYTEQGNYDLVGNNTPVFFIKDPLKFPDFIHSQKRDPYTGMTEPENIFDFWSHSPEALHQVTYLFGDRGIPASFRHMNGYGSHTYQWVNAAGEAFWVKYHFISDQGVKGLTAEEAAELAGADPDSHQRDLVNAIDRGEFPSWTLKVQIMPAAQAAGYRFHPFDVTKIWPHADYPLHEVGRLTLDRNPDNVFADVEQAAFSPNNFVPGIGPSPDKMLQGRLFAYQDAHRYRVGVNHTQLPVNRPHATVADNYGRDGALRFDGNHGRQKNYEPNSFDGPVETKEPLASWYEVDGLIGVYTATVHAEDSDYVQAGNLYRLFSPEQRAALAANLAAPLSQVPSQKIVDRFVGQLYKADPEYGASVEAAIKAMRENR
jgi:catalase